MNNKQLIERAELLQLKLGGLKKYIKEVSDMADALEEDNEALEDKNEIISENYEDSLKTNVKLYKDNEKLELKLVEANNELDRIKNTQFKPILSDTIAVNYFGEVFKVDKKAKYLATDCNGDLYSYINEPPMSEMNGIWHAPDAQYVSHIKFKGDWKKSLMKIEENTL